MSWASREYGFNELDPPDGTYTPKHARPLPDSPDIPPVMRGLRDKITVIPSREDT
jgi:hypothetical protein